MKKSILYLDDDAACLCIFQEMFGEEFDVRVALTATEARRMLAEREAEIIVSDQMMPGMRGTEFLREVAAGHAASYRVLLTGAALVGNVLPEISSGVIHTFITKPWTEDGIRRLVERADIGETAGAARRDLLSGGVGRRINNGASSSHSYGREGVHGEGFMKVLIAEDDPVSRRLLEATLAKWGYQLIVTTDGAEAFRHLSSDDPPRLAILDVMMPEMDGMEVCRRVRALRGGHQTYIILLTAKSAKGDIVEGLDAGADDYLSKPFDRAELRARVGAGIRIVELQQTLAERVRELEEALSKVTQLQELLPMCSYCKKVRDDQNYWQQVDSYISAHTATRISHGVCPDCVKSVLEPQMLKLRLKRQGATPKVV